MPKHKPLPKATKAESEISPTDVELAKDAYHELAVPGFRALLDAKPVDDAQKGDG